MFGAGRRFAAGARRRGAFQCIAARAEIHPLLTSVTTVGLVKGEIHLTGLPPIRFRIPNLVLRVQMEPVAESCTAIHPRARYSCCTGRTMPSRKLTSGGTVSIARAAWAMVSMLIIGSSSES